MSKRNYEIKLDCSFPEITLQVDGEQLLECLTAEEARNLAHVLTLAADQHDTLLGN